MSDNALRSAVFNELDGGSYSVYDYVPPEATYPYITLSYTESSDQGLVNAELESHFITITCWSEYLGAKEVLDMMEYITNRLHRVRLLLSTGRKATLWVRNRRATREIEDDTYMGNVTVEVVMQPGSV